MAETETFGQRLRRLLNKAKLSQQEVADSLSIPRNTVWRWINDKSTPESNNLHNLATLLHITTDELLNGAPDQGGWVLHVEIGNTKEDFIDMKTLASKPVCAIITDKDAGFIKVGGDYSLWTDDALFKKILADLKKLRDAVIANGKVLGGIKEQ